MSEKDLQRSIEAMLGDRRPPKGSLTPDEAAALRAAARLRSAHPGANTPKPEFVDELGRRLRERPASPAASRRSFLRGAGLAAAAAVVGVGADRIVAATTAEQTTSKRTAAAGELVPWQASWTPVTTVSELQKTPVVRFSAGAVTGFVIRNGAAITAMSAVCTHQGCILSAASDMSRLVCPCHEQTFALDGSPNRGDYYLAPLPQIKHRISGDAVEVFV